MMFGISPAPLVITVRLPFILLLVCAASLMAACEDATNVGESLVGAQGGHPVTDQFLIDGFEAAALERPDNLAPRVIAGAVEDPLLGTHIVHGYVDVTPISSSGFRAQPVERAELRLTKTYVYGDTTSEVTLALREITEEWSDEDLPTDTSFSVGPVIREFTVAPTDSLVIVSLPKDWVDDHDDVFRSADYGDLFHGFRLDPVSGNAVLGFGPNNSSLFAVSAEDSSDSPLGRSYPSIERTGDADLPDDRILMQAGTGPILSFDMLDDLPDYSASSVNRAAVGLTADTTALNQNVPAHFVRPILQWLDLFGITDAGFEVLVGRTSLDDEGRFVFDSQNLANAVQSAILDRETFDHFEIRIPDPNTISITQTSPNSLRAARYYYTSLNPIIFYDVGTEDDAPAGYLTITPLD